MKTYEYDDIPVGHEETLKMRLSLDTEDDFVGLSGDFNPLHYDLNYAATTKFKRPIAHGMILGCMLSTLVGTKLPGKHCLLISQTIDFVKPVYPSDDTFVELTGKVVSKQDAAKVLVVQLTFKVEDTLVARGKALVGVLQ